MFSQPSRVDSRRSAEARRGAPSLAQPALLNFRSLLTSREHQTPSNSPRARCALRQMTANPSSSCTCTSIRLNAYKDQRRRPGSLSGHRRSLLIASDYGANGLGCARAVSLDGERLPPMVLLQSHRTSCALLARGCSENEALIVDLLGWKKL